MSSPLALKRAVAGCAFCAVRDNARPPCKAWKREEKEEGSVAAPDSPPGEYTETRDGKSRGGLGRGAQCEAGKGVRMIEGGQREAAGAPGAPGAR